MRALYKKILLGVLIIRIWDLIDLKGFSCF